MPVRLTPPTKSSFHLAKSDEKYGITEATMIEVRLATQGEVESRNELFNNFRREFEGSKVTVSQSVSFDAVRRQEVLLTLASCNIEGPEGKPLFVFENGRIKDEAAFKKGWDLLPPDVADEIHDYVLEANPVWDLRGEA